MILHRARLRLLLTAAIALLPSIIVGCSRSSPALTPPTKPVLLAPVAENALPAPVAPAPPAGNREPAAPTSTIASPMAAPIAQPITQPLTQNKVKQATADATSPDNQSVAAPLDLSLSTHHETTLFDKNFDANGQDPYRNLFDLQPRPRERRVSVSGDIFWDEEKLKQEQVNYLDALKGGEISIEVKTP